MPTIYFPPRPPKDAAFPAWTKPHSSWIKHKSRVMVAQDTLRGLQTYWYTTLHEPLGDGTRIFTTRKGEAWVLCRDSHELALANNPHTS